jgi:hypothetical protein
MQEIENRGRASDFRFSALRGTGQISTALTERRCATSDAQVRFHIACAQRKE